MSPLSIRRARRSLGLLLLGCVPAFLTGLALSTAGPASARGWPAPDQPPTATPPPPVTATLDRPGTPTPTPFAGASPTHTGPPRTPTPEPAIERQPAPDGVAVHIPVIFGALPGESDCNVSIEVMNVGADPSKAVLIAWGDPSLCPPRSAGPLKVECTGLLRPGQPWILTGGQIPLGARNGSLYSFTARTLGELGLAERLGFDDIAADFMCETLFFGVVGDADDYRRFKQAYDDGGTFADVPLSVVRGGALAVSVWRGCPEGGDGAVRTVNLTYTGVPTSALGTFDPVFGGFGYFLPLAATGANGASTVLRIQHAGLACASAELWLVPRATDDAACDVEPVRCSVFTLVPGESAQIDLATACGTNEVAGSAWLRSTDPLAVVVDTAVDGGAGSHVAAPAEAARLTAPLALSRHDGWTTRVHVQNTDGVTSADVVVRLRDRSGDVVASMRGTLCPRAGRTFDLADMPDVPANYIGSLAIESLVHTDVVSGSLQPAIVAVVELARADPGGRGEVVHYLAEPVQPADLLPAGFGGRPSPPAVVGIPSLVKDRARSGVATELAIAITVDTPGFTDFAMFIFDQNGLLDFVCQKLNQRQVEYIDLDTFGFVAPGFKGSAVVSAVFWEHDVFSPTGEWIANHVGLAAVTLERRSADASGQPSAREGTGTEAFGRSLDAGGFGLDTAFPVFCPSGPARPTPIRPLPSSTPPPTPTSPRPAPPAYLPALLNEIEAPGP